MSHLYSMHTAEDEKPVGYLDGHSPEASSRSASYPTDFHQRKIGHRWGITTIRICGQMGVKPFFKP